MKKQLVSVFIIIIFWGCTSLSPQYVKPQAPIPERLPVTKDDNLPDVHTVGWEEFITDHKMRQVIHLAIKNNRDLRLAMLNVEKARALYNIQRAELYPSVSASGTASKQKISEDFVKPGSSATTEQYGISIGITAWEMDFFGRIRNLKDAELEEFLATEEAKKGAYVSLIGAVSEAYLVLAADRENLLLALKNAESQKKAFEIIKNRFNAGVSTELDLQRAKALLESVNSDVIYYRQNVEKDKNALNLLVGQIVPEELLPEGITNVSPPKEFAMNVSSEILLKRPDIKMAEHRLKEVYANIGAARATFFPRITLTTSFGTASNELSGLFQSGSGTWLFAPQLHLPIFDTRIKAAYKATLVEKELAVTRYEKAIQTAFKELLDILITKQTIKERLDTHLAFLNAVNEAYNISSQRYEKGIENYLSVIDSLRTLINGKQRFVDIKMLNLINQIKLYTALGGGV